MRSNRILRVLALAVCAALLLGSMLSCSGPNLSDLPGEELRGYTAMKTENYEITGGMYAYLFLEIGAAYANTIPQEEIDEHGFDENKRLRDQKYDKKRTWYDYIGEYVNQEIESLLIMCEAATEAGITLTNEDYAYVNEQLTGMRTQVVLYYRTDFESHLQDKYFGYVKEEDVTKVLLMETLAAKYDSHLHALIEERMTQERIDAHLETMTFENGKDETITRNLGHILSSSLYYDEMQSYENVTTALKRLEAAGKTEEAFAELWEEFSDDANMVYKNVSQGDMVGIFDDWLFAEGREVGDTGILSSEDGSHLVFYISEGDPAYIAEAKVELEEIIAQEIRAELGAKIKIKVKKNVLNAIDV